MRALLISTYELGRQPFGLASPAAWLREAGIEVECLDLAVRGLDEDAVRRADFVGFYLPMHTAARIATAVLPAVRRLNPDAELGAFGLYAPVSAQELRRHGVGFVAGGEFEAALTARVRRLTVRRDSDPVPGDQVPGDPGSPAAAAVDGSPAWPVSLERLAFRRPHRDGLPPLREYAQLCLPDGSRRVVGATEATRGCKHLCRHCPVVPVYEGAFRVVQPEVVLADVEQLVAAGAEHVTFGDPDFFNGPAHAERIVRRLHARFPELSYDVTIKVEHLLAHADRLPLLRDTGCVLVTSAVESIDDRVLELLDKGHTCEDFVRAVALCRDAGLSLQPTFLPFTPWTSLAGHAELLRTLVKLDLVGQVAPIQLAIRLLIPRGSRLLELAEVRDLVGPYDVAALGYPWEHADPRVDALQRRLERIVEESADAGLDRGRIFGRVWEATREALDAHAGAAVGSLGEPPPLPDRATVPYLTEPWYC